MLDAVDGDAKQGERSNSSSDRLDRTNRSVLLERRDSKTSKQPAHTQRDKHEQRTRESRERKEKSIDHWVVESRQSRLAGRQAIRGLRVAARRRCGGTGNKSRIEAKMAEYYHPISL